MAPMMFDGHSTARSLSRMECLNEWMTQLSGTLGFSHLLIAAEAELTLLDEPRVISREQETAVKSALSRPKSCPRGFPNQWNTSYASFGFEPSPRMWDEVYVRYLIIQIDVCDC
jgi:hypothetical protein